MNISRFFGSTNREAMRQVRMALGPDALIVSNRRVNGGVEILATDPTAAGGDGDVLPESVHIEPPLRSESAVAPTPDVMHAIGDLRGALESRIDELMWGNQLRRAPQAVSLFQALLGFGFSTALLRAMLKRLPEQLAGKAALQWARQELIKHLPVLRGEDDLWRPGLALALVGPTGVGKTTTLAKLAARAVRRFGPQNVVLLTTDTYRIGAHEQLKIYGQIMRVPVHVIQDGAELRQVVQGIRSDQVILVDNVGISQRDSYVSEQAAMLAGAGRQVQRLLVLNAASHGDTLDEVARTYRNDGGTPLAGCIVTKLDEATRLGAILDTAIRYQLPIHYVSNGQKVPENLLFLSATELVDQTLASAPAGSALYAPTEADLAALMSVAKPAAATVVQGVSDERRRLLLPGLLSASGVSSQALSAEQAQQACNDVDEHAASAEAFDLWQAHSVGTPVSLDNGGYARHAWLKSQTEIHQEAPPPCPFVVHDQAAISTPQDGVGRLRVSLVGSLGSGALLSPLQSLQFADGWMSSCGSSALQAPSTAEAWRHQVRWFQQQDARGQLLHLFEGGAQAQWRLLDDLRLSWVAQCAPGTRVFQEDGATTVGALLKQVSYQPFDATRLASVLQTVASRPLDHMTFWTGMQPVSLQARGQAPLPLSLWHVRVQDRRDGSVLRQFSALGRTTLADDAVFQALLLRQEQKWVLRAAQVFWRLFQQQGTAGSLQDRALLATQMGMAGWQLLQNRQSAAARQALFSLGMDAARSVNGAATGLLRLFAMKEMMD